MGYLLLKVFQQWVFQFGDDAVHITEDVEGLISNPHGLATTAELFDTRLPVVTDGLRIEASSSNHRGTASHGVNLAQPFPPFSTRFTMSMSKRPQ